MRRERCRRWRRSAGVALPDDGVTTIAVLGAVGPDKGARRLERLAALVRSARLPVRFVLIGYMDVEKGPWQSDDAVLTVHGRYEPRDLPDLLAQYRVQLVAFPSAGPETFSFTLSEAWAAGLPVIVPPFGALAERVARCECRLVVDRRRMARRSPDAGAHGGACRTGRCARASLQRARKGSGRADVARRDGGADVAHLLRSKASAHDSPSSDGHRGGCRWTRIDDAPARGNADDSQDVAAHAGARAQSPQGAAPVMATLEPAPAGHEALRHAALYAAREERSDAPELARRYAELCARKFAPPVPLLWPRAHGRTGIARSSCWRVLRCRAASRRRSR